MAQLTHFSVARGNVVSDCLPQTKQFIEGNLAFFYGALSRLSDALGSDGPLLFLSHEDQWSFGCRIDKTELGNIAVASGVLRDGGANHSDAILKVISQ